MSTRAKLKEAPVKDRIKDVLDSKRVWYCMPPANGYGKSGNFDFIVCVRGAFLGIEAKRDEKEMPTRLQTENAVKVAGNEGVILLIHKDNVHLVGETVDEMLRRMADVRVYYKLNQWPQKAMMAMLDKGDEDVKVIKGKKK
jgi:hypothetical protein